MSSHRRRAWDGAFYPIQEITTDSSRLAEHGKTYRIPAKNEPIVTNVTTRSGHARRAIRWSSHHSMRAATRVHADMTRRACWATREQVWR